MTKQDQVIIESLMEVRKELGGQDISRFISSSAYYSMNDALRDGLI